MVEEGLTERLNGGFRHFDPRISVTDTIWDRLLILVNFDQLLIVRRHECGNGANALPIFMTFVARAKQLLKCIAHTAYRLRYLNSQELRISVFLLL